jgi:hypothetical protein
LYCANGTHKLLGGERRSERAAAAAELQMFARHPHRWFKARSQNHLLTAKLYDENDERTKSAIQDCGNNAQVLGSALTVRPSCRTSRECDALRQHSLRSRHCENGRTHCGVRRTVPEDDSIPSLVWRCGCPNVLLRRRRRWELGRGRGPHQSPNPTRGRGSAGQI